LRSERLGPVAARVAEEVPRAFFQQYPDNGVTTIALAALPFG